MSRILNREFYAEVAKGNIPKHSVVHKFGSGTLTTTLTPVTQTNTYPTPTTAQSLEFVSSSASDALNSTGAFEITFIGLDANWDEQSVSVAAHATDGTIAVAIPGTWLRLYRWYVSQSGVYATDSVGSHVGTLTTQISGGGTIWDTIPITPFQVGQSQIGAYTIPSGFTGYMIAKNVTVDSSKVTDMYFFQRPLADDVTTPFTGTMRMVERELNITVPFNQPFVIPKGPFVGPCDVGFMGKVSLTTGVASVEFELLLVED
jgi:hypothetical protein